MEDGLPLAEPGLGLAPDDRETDETDSGRDERPDWSEVQSIWNEDLGGYLLFRCRRREEIPEIDPNLSGKIADRVKWSGRRFG